MRTIQATVKRIEPSNTGDNVRLTVRVRRGYRDETCYYRADTGPGCIGKLKEFWAAIRIGSRVEVYRKVNNPYLQFVRVVSL